MLSRCYDRSSDTSEEGRWSLSRRSSVVPLSTSRISASTQEPLRSGTPMSQYLVHLIGNSSQPSTVYVDKG